jgi:acyl dehydratase
MTARAGDLLPERVVERVDPEKMKILAALLRDPNMIHLDPAASARAGLGHRLVNQGPINLGYVHTLLADWAGGADRVRASAFRLLGNVYDEERVVAGGRVLAVGAAGLVECEVWLDAERAEGRVRVVSGTATVVAGRGAP